MVQFLFLMIPGNLALIWGVLNSGELHMFTFLNGTLLRGLHKRWEMILEGFIKLSVPETRACSTSVVWKKQNNFIQRSYHPHIETYAARSFVSLSEPALQPQQHFPFLWAFSPGLAGEGCCWAVGLWPILFLLHSGRRKREGSWQGSGAFCLFLPWPGVRKRWKEMLCCSPLAREKQKCALSEISTS